MQSSQMESESFIQALVSVDKESATGILTAILQDGRRDMNEVEELIITALNTIGDGWEKEVYSLSQVYMSGIICEELFSSLLLNKADNLFQSPKIGIASFIDHHALGKRIVLSVIRSSGYNVTDLGEGLSVDQLVQVVQEENIEVLLLSTLMLPSALKIKLVKERFDALNIHVKIIAGGAPFRFDTQLWHRVGADADGKNASDIVNIIKKVVED